MCAKRDSKEYIGAPPNDHVLGWGDSLTERSSVKTRAKIGFSAPLRRDPMHPPMIQSHSGAFSRISLLIDADDNGVVVSTEYCNVDHDSCTASVRKADRMFKFAIFDYAVSSEWDLRSV